VEPTKEKIKSHYKEISDTIWEMKAATPWKLIEILQPKISGWANYYKTVHSSKAFGKLDMLIWRRLYQWARRRHPNRGKRWVADKYFGTVNGRKWTFAEIKGKGKDREIVKFLKGYSKYKERTGSYARVGYDRSFYDGDTAYWAERLSKGYGNITPAKAKMLKRQDGICPVCKCAFTNQDLPEAHHIKPRQYGGLWEFKNMVLVHLHCHDKVHREYAKQKRKMCRDQREYERLIANGIHISSKLEEVLDIDVAQLRSAAENRKSSTETFRTGTDVVIDREDTSCPFEILSKKEKEDISMIRVKKWSESKQKWIHKSLPRDCLKERIVKVRDETTKLWINVTKYFRK